MSDQSKIIWRKDLQDTLKVTSETVRRWMRDGKLPTPDVNLSGRTKGWKKSTLDSAGIRF